LTSTVRWLPWNAQAFTRARAEDKPVLLSIAAFWSESCQEMDRTTYADPEIAATIEDRFVPIRVDADRRPDIAERYSLGGWPTTAFLTADGDVIGGGTFVSLDRMASVLDRVSDAWRSGHPAVDDDRTPRVADALGASPIAATTDDPAALAAIVFDSFDAEHGGFGKAPKFPLTAPLELALALYRHSPDPSLSHIVEASLDAIGWGELYDDFEGGVFRCAETMAWREPHREKLLEINASVVRIFLEASETLKIDRYRERAEDILRYVQTWLADQVDGAWAASQRAGDTQTGQSRVDPTLYAGPNAVMASAALRAAELFDDTSLGEFAIRSLERIVVGAYRPGAGVAHDLGPPPSMRGFLEDQISMATAHLDAHDATGNVVYEMMAQELLHYAIRTMWDEHGGGFFDRTVPEHADRIGRLRDRVKPFVTNCDAARALRRAAVTRGDHDFGERATATLAAMAPLAPSQGPLAAHYLLALKEP
jgi:uncharacterized protein